METKTVLVTGTSSGIGLETAVRLAERGCAVYASMRNLQKREALEAEAARRNAAVTVLQLDITKPESIRGCIETVLDRAGRIDALVNNAGLYMRGFFEDTSDGEIQQVFETNVFGTMAVTRAVLPHMRSAGRGRILAVSSVAGRSGAVTASVYCSSKFALEGFFESLSQEVSPLGIAVTIIEPAILRSDKWATDAGSTQQAREQGSEYTQWYRQAKRMMDRVARSSPTQNGHVAEAICRVLQARRPRLRYMVGSRARLVFALRRYVPGDLVERFSARVARRQMTRS